MNAPKLLRFKIATSFAFASLGLIAFARLAASEPASGATMLAFVTLSIFVIAAAWRGFIYVRAMRGPAKQ